MGRRMILMHEDWHRDTLDDAIVEYVCACPTAHTVPTPLRSTRARHSCSELPAQFARFGAERRGAARFSCLSQSHRIAAIPHPDFSGGQNGRAAVIRTDRGRGRIIRAADPFSLQPSYMPRLLPDPVLFRTPLCQTIRHYLPLTARG